MIYSKSQIPEHLHCYFRPAEYGLESSPGEYVETMRALFAEVRRVLADDGTLWLNIGDSYVGSANSGAQSPKRVDARGVTSGESVRITGLPSKGRGIPAKNLLGIPWRVAFALQDDGWILRNDIIWNKPNAMPESVTDRLSTRHEHLFMFSKSTRYWFDLDPIREALARPEALDEGIVFGGKNTDVGRRRGATYGKRSEPWGGVSAPQANMEATGVSHDFGHERGRNPGDVWTVATQPFTGAHFAVMPQELARRAIVAGCKPGGTVLDPFSGSGTTGHVAQKNGRKYVGIDLSRDYLDLSLRTRLQQGVLDLGGETA